jgi:cobalt-zinc-cadmium efflux system outer membrane protein
MVRIFQLYFCVTILCLSAGFSRAADSHYTNFQLATEIDPLKQQAEITRLTDKASVSLDDLLKAAILLNPVIAAAQNDIGAAKGRLRQAGQYPNPTIEFEAEDIPASDVDFSRNQNTVSIIQPIIFGKRRSTAISAAAAEQEVFGFELQHTINQVLGDVRLAYVDLAYYERAFTLHGELLAIADKTLEIVRARFEEHAATEVELIAAQLKSRKIRLNRTKVKRERASSIKRLQSFFPEVPLTAERIHVELPVNLPGIDLEDLLADVYEQHPLMLASKKKAEAAEHRLALANAERIPDVSFRGAYGRDTTEGENIVEFGISIPLPLFNRNQGRIAEARHLVDRSHNDAKFYGTRLEAEITAAQASYMAARDYAAEYQAEIVPAVERAFKQVLERYRAGRTEIPDLLNAQEETADAKLSLLEAMWDMNRGYALLHKIAGPVMKEIPVKELKGDF